MRGKAELSPSLCDDDSHDQTTILPNCRVVRSRGIPVAGQHLNLAKPVQHFHLLLFAKLHLIRKYYSTKGGVAGPDAPKIQALPKLG